MNLNGVEYNLTDKDAQSKITELQKNTYNKTEVDNLVNAIDSKVDGINLDSFETKEGAASKYQPKGTYLTEHQSLDNYYTKAEVDSAVENIDVTEQLKDYALKSELPAEYDDTSVKARISTLEAIDHTKYLTQHQDISGKVDKVSGKGLSTNDYTTAEKNKLAATPSFWVGTQAEYDAITNKDTNTFYYITEE